MIYLDYSATTPVDNEVLTTFNKVCNEFVGNANSMHSLGINANNLINMSTKQIMNLLNTSKNIIYTSGSSESNNLAIKGIALEYQNRGKHIITTKFEHSSVYGPLNYLESLGFQISYVKTNEYGIVDLNNLEELMTNETILVCINAINSEIGIRQPVEEIGKFLKKYPKCFYHVDLTQAIGKIKINLESIDTASFSAHKIYGLKGIGGLIVNNNIKFVPLINGGKSTSEFRSGTPAHPLIASFAKALRLITNNIETNYSYVQEINSYLKKELKKYNDVYINSNDYCIPHILNISIIGIKSETFMRALSNNNIFVSTKSACNNESSMSESVYALTNDTEKAKTSIRISLSHLTTYDEINKFLIIFNSIYNELKNLN